MSNQGGNNAAAHAWEEADEAGPDMLPVSECFSPSHSGPGLISGNSAISRSLNRLLIDQVRIASADSPTGEPELGRLLELVSRHYEAMDEERRGVVRSMRLLADEAQALRARGHASRPRSQLQAILDHIKDAILTVDETRPRRDVQPDRRARLRL